MICQIQLVGDSFWQFDSAIPLLCKLSLRKIEGE